jgi:hypothetical protein
MNASDPALDVRYSRERQELQKWRCVLVKVANAGFWCDDSSEERRKGDQCSEQFSYQFSSVQFIGCSIRFSSV